jgi:hypothetical protein
MGYGQEDAERVVKNLKDWLSFKNGLTIKAAKAKPAPAPPGQGGTPAAPGSQGAGDTVPAPGSGTNPPKPASDPKTQK